MVQPEDFLLHFHGIGDYGQVGGYSHGFECRRVPPGVYNISFAVRGSLGDEVERYGWDNTHVGRVNDYNCRNGGEVSTRGRESGEMGKECLVGDVAHFDQVWERGSVGRWRGAGATGVWRRTRSSSQSKDPTSQSLLARGGSRFRLSGKRRRGVGFGSYRPRECCCMRDFSWSVVFESEATSESESVSLARGMTACLHRVHARMNPRRRALGHEHISSKVLVPLSCLPD